MKHHSFGDEGLKTHITLATLVFAVIMAGLGALAVVTNVGKWMLPPSPSSLAAPISKDAPPPSK